MNESDIYYVDTRNADSRDHRTQGGSSGAWRPAGPVRAVVAQPASIYAPQPPYAQPPFYGNPYMNPYAQPQSSRSRPIA